MIIDSFLKLGQSVVVHNTDLSDRDKVLEELREFFGWENVVPISNYNRFATKSLIKDLAKFNGIPFDEVNKATASVDREVRQAVTKHGDDKNLFVLTFDEAMSFHCKHQSPADKPICSGCHDECRRRPVSPSFRAFIEKYPVVAESIKILFKQNRSLGRHAGGVLIADDLPNKMPLICSKGEPQSPWCEGVNFKHLEYIGNFIKYDLLGLETLRLIERTIELILTKERSERGWFELELADGSKRGFFGDELIGTINRGQVLVKDLVPGDDIDDTSIIRS
jgi:DNA polymerase III alpha subunit